MAATANTPPPPLPAQDPGFDQPLSSDLVAVHLGGCLSPDHINACVLGTLNPVDRDTVMAHLAACADCSAQYNLLLGPKARKPTLFSHGRWRWWLLATGIVVTAPLLLFSGKGKETPPPPNKPLTAAATIAPRPTPPPVQLPQPATQVQRPAAQLQPPVVQAQRPTVQGQPPAAKAPAPAPVAAPAAPTAVKAPTPAPATAAAPPAPARGSALLMTAKEAALPSSTQVGFAGVSVDDGPTIIIDKPGDGATVSSGFPLYILYDAAGRESIDVDTVKLICRKQPPINLTPRIKQQITAKGIWLENVQLPPGTYRLKLSLADTLGRPAEREFSIKVTD